MHTSCAKSTVQCKPYYVQLAVTNPISCYVQFAVKVHRCYAKSTAQYKPYVQFVCSDSDSDFDSNVILMLILILILMPEEV